MTLFHQFYLRFFLIFRPLKTSTFYWYFMVFSCKLEDFKTIPDLNISNLFQNISRISDKFVRKNDVFQDFVDFCQILLIFVDFEVIFLILDPSTLVITVFHKIFLLSQTLKYPCFAPFLMLFSSLRPEFPCDLLHFWWFSLDFLDILMIFMVLELWDPWFPWFEPRFSWFWTRFLWFSWFWSSETLDFLDLSLDSLIFLDFGALRPLISSYFDDFHGFGLDFHGFEPRFPPFLTWISP